MEEENTFLMGGKKITATVVAVVSSAAVAVFAQNGFGDLATPEQIESFVNLALGGGGLSLLSYLGIQSKADALGYAKSALRSKRFWTTILFALSLPGAAIIAPSLGMSMVTILFVVKILAFLATGMNAGIGAHDIVQLGKALR